MADDVRIESLNDQGFLERVTRSGNPSLIFIGDYDCTICHAAFTVVGEWWQKKTGLNLFYVEGKANPQTRQMLGGHPLPSVTLMHGREVYGTIAGAAMGEKELTALLAEFTKTVTKPKLIRRLSTFLAAIFRAIRARKLTAPKSVSAARLSKCIGCVYNQRSICTECGCFVDLKAKLPTETCPKGFW